MKYCGYVSSETVDYIVALDSFKWRVAKKIIKPTRYNDLSVYLKPPKLSSLRNGASQRRKTLNCDITFPSLILSTRSGFKVKTGHKHHQATEIAV